MSLLPPATELTAAITARREWAVTRLGEWVREASTLGNEAGAQHKTAALYEEIGYAPKILPVDIDRLRKLPGYSPVDWSYDGRPNVVAVHDVPNAKGRSLVFNGHVDVVSGEPAELWTTPPFEPVVLPPDANGETWMRGRGAADMKGGSMCFLWALGVLRDLGLEPASRVVLQSPIEEECTGNGALALFHEGYTADACLIPEPFAENILARQVGVIWFDVEVLGKTTHVLGAGRGVNAIEKAWKIIEALRAFEEKVNNPEYIPESWRHVAHPINLNVGIIQGGDWASTVAGKCTVRFRFGAFPGQSLEQLNARLRECVADAASNDPWLREFPPRVTCIGFQAEGCEFPLDSAFGKTLADVHRDLRGRDAELLSATCTTDVRFPQLYYGIPATCYGPASKSIHGPDEVVSIDSMQRVAEAMIHLVDRWCGVRKVAR